jgi:hypothetical protein
MSQWRILVLGTLRLGLNADYDRVQELANQHRLVLQMRRHSDWANDHRYSLQTLKDKLRMVPSGWFARGCNRPWWPQQPELQLSQRRPRVSLPLQSSAELMSALGRQPSLEARDSALDFSRLPAPTTQGAYRPAQDIDQEERRCQDST